MSLSATTHLYLDIMKMNGNTKCFFCGENYGNQLAHIVANSDANKKIICKRLRTTKSEAQFLLDMPLLNAVYSCPACNGILSKLNNVNGKTCKSADITLIDYRYFEILPHVLKEIDNNFITKFYFIKDFILWANRKNRNVLEKEIGELVKLQASYQSHCVGFMA